MPPPKVSVTVLLFGKKFTKESFLANLTCEECENEIKLQTNIPFGRMYFKNEITNSTSQIQRYFHNLKFRGTFFDLSGGEFVFYCNKIVVTFI
jgi:hypothetical protein